LKGRISLVTKAHDIASVEIRQNKYPNNTVEQDY
jgi:hypothetical protein